MFIKEERVNLSVLKKNYFGRMGGHHTEVRRRRGGRRGFRRFRSERFEDRFRSERFEDRLG